MIRIEANPHPFPHDGLSRAATALVVVDMQRDFLEPEGYFGALGYDPAGCRAALPGVAALLAAARAAGLFVVHSRQGYRPDLMDLPAHKAWRTAHNGAPIGSPGPLGRLLVRGEPGWQIVPELAPAEGEAVVDKSANGAFFDTDLDTVLRVHGIRHLIVCGITTDCCVHCTVREANDRGYHCLLVSDACGSGDARAHEAAVYMMTVEGGVLGATATVAEVRAALAGLALSA
ncbi:cysteine hydrolase [Paralimibaculum aggregatum]|uniref:Cysteine hydrolase n=1 Tax=Paralimibaculum aggregatum TaxID=3036245 RepID=A0ABQ6LGP1_9RHOB|nr:isochorismatase family cysteine hydrolase [Limibaculum sp. NKW23]GMG81581.1 cysteine hydrolase [Limibaculum sp. NKW23]